MRDKKEYDRKYSRKKYAEFIQRRENVVKSGTIGDCCFICKKSAKRDFHFHHCVYLEESNYPKNCKSGATRWKRLKEAEQFPERFKLLCGKCHLEYETIKRNKNIKNILALLKLENNPNVQDIES